VAAVGIDKTKGAAATATSGWTVARSYTGTSVSQIVAWRVADGTATDLSCTLTWTTAQGAQAIIAEIDLDGATLASSTITPATANDTSVTSISGDPGAATGAGVALAFLSVDSADPGSTTNWTNGYTVLRSEIGASLDTNAPDFNGGASIIMAGKDVVSGTTTTTAASWTPTKTDQMALAVLRFAGTVGPPTPVLTTQMIGIPTADSVGVAVRTSSATSVRAQVSPSPTFTTGIISGSAVSPNAQGDSQLDVSGLANGVSYYLRIGMTVQDVETFSAPTARPFTTDIPGAVGSFSFCFASCENTPDAVAFATIAARDDDFFLHLGDWFDDPGVSIYADGTGNTVANYRTQFVRKIQAPNHIALYADTPMSFTPSDHDWMNDGAYNGTDAVATASFNQVVREVLPLRGIPATTGVYRTWAKNRVRFIQMDTRSFRGASNTTILGTVQKQWLKDAISAAIEPVIILVQDGTWIGTTGGDTWGLYPTERTELANYFAASGKQISMLGGDMHGLAADDGTNAPGGIAVFQAAPLYQNASQKGGPYTVGPYPASGTAIVQQYGRMVVTDNGSTISLAFTGYSSDNTQRVTMTETYVAPAVQPPTGLTASASGTTAIGLSWSPATGATGYDLERNGVVIATNRPGTTYSDTGLDPGTEYTYRVRSVG